MREGQPLTVLMNFSDFLKQNGGAFVKATANNNGLNIRNSEGQVIATILMTEVPAEEEVLDWVKSRLNHTVVSNAQNQIIRLNAPVDKGIALESLFESPAPVKAKVKA